MDYATPEQARDMPGLRLVLQAGAPAPWSESAKTILKLKGIPFVPVRQEVAGPNEILVTWTGHRNAPIAIWENEPPRTGWSDILMLAERLRPEPALVPTEISARADMFGMCHLVCGENGFGWNRRHLMGSLVAAKGDGMTDGDRAILALLRGYGYCETEAAAAPGRIAAILRYLAQRLHAQESRGSHYFIGDGLTALDIYWACFATLLDPLPPEVNPMPDAFFALYRCADPVVAEVADPILLRHRNFIYERHLGLPLDF